MASLKRVDTRPDITPDIGGPGITLLIVGEQPGPMSAKKQQYYALPANRFWPTLAKLGFTPRQLAPEEFPLLPQFGIGITDLKKKTVHNDGSEVTDADRIRLAQTIKDWRPKLVGFTSVMVARQFFQNTKIEAGEIPVEMTEDFPDIRFFALASTSPRNGHFQRHYHSWELLAEFFGKLR